MAKLLSTTLLFVFVFGALAGCDNSEVSRVPSQESIQKSNEQRSAEIDKLNLPQAQKDQMKAHLGGSSSDRNAAPTGGK